MSTEPRERLTRLMDGYLSTQLLYLAARLGTAEVLASGPLASAELARRVGADAGALHRVLRGLVIEAVLRERADGRFELTAAGDLLRADAPGSVRGAVIARGEGDTGDPRCRGDGHAIPRRISALLAFMSTPLSTISVDRFGG